MILRYWVMSPLHRWELGEADLTRDIRIRRLEERKAPDLSLWGRFLARDDVERIAKCPWWLVCEVQEEFHRREQREQATETVRQTLDALHILAPVGSDSVIACCEVRDGRLEPDSFEHFQPFHPTLWAKLIKITGVKVEELTECAESVHQAFEKKIVRLQTPIQLLEHGLQATNMHIRLLMWAMALDALLVAQRQDVFERRLCNFLGPEEFVFPTDYGGRQPIYRVRDVAGNLYALRGVIAHGNEIPERFRKQVGFQVLGLHQVGGPISDCQLRELLHECALFLLCAVLKKILLSNLVDLVANTRRWQRHLDGLVGQAPAPSSPAADPSP